MEMKRFVDWFEDKSVLMDVKKMSKQHFSGVPTGGPVRKAMASSAIQMMPLHGCPPQLLLAPLQKHYMNINVKK